MPSPTEIRIKVEAAERMVARAEKRLATETEAHQETLKKYELRVQEDRAAGRRGDGRRSRWSTRPSSFASEHDW